ncbi:hypothetical protein EO98_04780 [Methanosarcina sp. 2.H.T.1A.6]|uniref:hypothetical protein n=1 Tax=unclassified Methanosarcina TaxID=2644672 RepID=UPI000620FBEE|nr:MULTISPECIES: hypothetical protein [unclassified Methanosarcina]KKG16017.1 hypothetical protein EO94_05220 [Methanosarcina sp. 2.H.T.1A.3]KKG21298.1 hypothetical protein EO98_04780 [Methanosarcina sp. 2.H.T.1A.6]KKG24134.1 hypothetical protein EO96_14145 [Methanosarcina sp. 2.H.T.1A.8]KKG28689.1 hypothetical protein EO97_14865 [Methanosarcina sp. 2.H.T.1A.15]
MNAKELQKKSKCTYRTSKSRQKEGVTQVNIIEFILNASDGIANELDIPEKLKMNESTIRKHMPLLYESYCVDWIHPDPDDKKRKKIWSIRRIENLRNIRKEYPEIKLNTYKTALDIIIKTFITRNYPCENNRFREQLQVSESFFDLCVLNDPDTLFQNAWKSYQHSEGFEKYRRVKNCINKLISDYAKYHPNVEMTEELFLKTCREIPVEELKEILKDAIDEVGYGAVFEALTYDLLGCVTNLDNVFENCVLNDISSGRANPKEIDIIYRKKDAQARLREEIERDPVSAVEKMIQDNRLSGPEINIALKMLTQKCCESQQRNLNLLQTYPKNSKFNLET